MTEPTLIRIARILRSHGLKGELKIAPDHAYLEKIPGGSGLIAETRFHERVPVSLKSFRIGNDTIVKLEGIDDKTAADRFAQGSLLIEESKLGSLPSGTYYVKDLIGLTVMDEKGVKVGTISDVQAMPAQDVYEIVLEGSDRKAMIPAVPEFIKQIDLKDRTMKIHVIPGLLGDNP